MFEEVVPEKNETVIQPVEVCFGDVIQPFDQGQPTDRLQVVIDTAENHLQASSIIKRGDSPEYLSMPGTLELPVQVVGHWEFDKVLDGSMYLIEEGRDSPSPEGRQKMEKQLRLYASKPPVMYTGRESGL